MQAWSADFFYEFGDIASYRGSFYFCLAVRTRLHPSEVSDWARVDAVVEELPSCGETGQIILVEGTGQCFILSDKWTELSKRHRTKIAFSNRNPKPFDLEKLWVNEAEGLIFKRGDSGWSLINSAEDEIFELPFPPSRLDDEADSSGNGVVTMGAFWIDESHDKIYQNEDPTRGKSIWRKL